MRSFEELVGLINQLYQPGNAVHVSEIQHLLQKAQKLESGWQLAEACLNHHTANVRFFGALTYTVKINNDGNQLSGLDSLILLDKLLATFVHLVNQGEGALVLTKFCSTLVTFFLLPSAPWQKCLRHLMCCFLKGRTFPEHVELSAGGTSQLVTLLEQKHLLAILLFMQLMAEDVAKVDHSNQKFHYIRQRVDVNMHDMCAILEYAMTVGSSPNDRACNEALAAYSAWLVYAATELSAASPHRADFQRLLLPCVTHLLEPHSFEVVAGLLTDLFLSHGTFVTTEINSSFTALLHSDWNEKHLQDLSDCPEDQDALTYAQLVLAFGQAHTHELYELPHKSTQLMRTIHLITTTQNHETVVQSLSNAIIDFWEMWISDVEEFVLASTIIDEAAFGNAKSHWLQAIEELCLASRLPISEREFVHSSTEDAFKEFRTRVRGAIHDSYACFGISVLEKLTLLTLNIDTKAADFGTMLNWSTLEALLHCMGGLSTSMEYRTGNGDDEQMEDHILQTLFSSALFAALADQQSSAPARLRKSVLRIIGEHDKFLGRYPSYLQAAIETLLGCLADTRYMEVSGHAISKLCDANRKVLIPKLEFLLDMMEQFFLFNGATQSTREQISEAVASVAQAVESSQDRSIALSRILQVLEDDLGRRTQQAASPTDISLHEIALDTIRLLGNVANGFRTPEDAVIDLETEQVKPSSFWIHGDGARTQTRIVSLVETLTREFPNDGQILEAACNVMIAGIRELTVGPFVFAAEVVVNFIMVAPLNNPRLDVLLRTVSVFLSFSKSLQIKDETLVTRLLNHVWIVVQYMVEPTNDPDLAYNLVDAMSMLSTLHFGLFGRLPVSVITRLLSFSVKCIEAPEILAKRSGTKFFTSLLKFRPTSTQDGDTITRLIRLVLPDLVKALIHNIAGYASRSQLEWVAEPYRRLVKRCPEWRSCTEQALYGSDFPSSRVDDATKRRFVLQVASLRGDERTHTIIKDFWLICRGMPNGYG